MRISLLYILPLQPRRMNSILGSEHKRSPTGTERRATAPSRLANWGQRRKVFQLLHYDELPIHSFPPNEVFVSWGKWKR